VKCRCYLVYISPVFLHYLVVLLFPSKSHQGTYQQPHNWWYSFVSWIVKNVVIIVRWTVVSWLHGILLPLPNVCGHKCAAADRWNPTDVLLGTPYSVDRSEEVVMEGYRTATLDLKRRNKSSVAYADSEEDVCINFTCYWHYAAFQ